MDHAALLAAFARDGAAFGDAADSVDMGANVASCPGWTIADLVWHLTHVHHFWRTIVDRALSSPAEYVPPDRPLDAELVAFYRAGLIHTVRVLTAADAVSPVWTWSDDQSVAFVIRRIAHETAVHRWDAQLAAGRATSIEPALASDGIDEFLTHFIGEPRDGAEPVGGSVHLHCTDVAGEWTLRPDDSGFLLSREHAKGDCAIRGNASDILLALWRRTPSSTLDLVGDTAMVERFIAAANLH